MRVDQPTALGALLERVHAFLSPDRTARLAALADQTPRLVETVGSCSALIATPGRRAQRAFDVEADAAGVRCRLVRSAAPGPTDA